MSAKTVKILSPESEVIEFRIEMRVWFREQLFFIVRSANEAHNGAFRVLHERTKQFLSSAAFGSTAEEAKAVLLAYGKQGYFDRALAQLSQIPSLSYD